VVVVQQTAGKTIFIQAVTSQEHPRGGFKDSDAGQLQLREVYRGFRSSTAASEIKQAPERNFYPLPLFGN